MIHFFRRIRQKLIAENRLTRYLIYAVGEIVLVMIGILLALQVNNWNEQRKQKNSEYAALVDLHQEFSFNTSGFTRHLGRKEDVSRSIDLLIEAIAGDASLDSLLYKERGSSGSATYNPSQSVIQSVIETGMINVISNDSLRNHLTNWNDLLQDYFEDEEWHIRFLHSEMYKYETENIPMHYYKAFIGDEYISPFHNKDEMGDFFNKAYNDPVYRNLLLRNYQYLDGTIKEGIRVKEMMNTIVRLLEQEIEGAK